MLLLDYWKNIPGFDRYQASYSGQIRHLGRIRKLRGYNFVWVPDQVLRGRKSGYGYLKIYMSEYGKNFDEYIHILVAKTFIPNPLNLKEVNHINRIKEDNRVENLEWCTHSYNIRHAYETKNPLLKEDFRKPNPMKN